ncbi:ubiquitin carboxyl-terminal hydrolase CYLD-like [Triplophysa dalaica]|uniref:ubiquitin carboxyl-terminal hydrolase CYLD-like n=1 Tax=Triplophysa dalaica TaxID=1582913 RepID=UPI0024DF793A|nr:ubiquitin carboxyl-terminal hydrolase CYLD-like [Triplophysa dalaica]
MSGDAHQGRRRRPPRMYVVESDYKLQDHLEGTIRLQRGQLCQEQEEGGKKSARGEYLWVKVIDIGSMVKIDTRVLAEVRADFAGLLEPVRHLEERLRLLAKPHRLQRLASLALGSEVWVYWNQSREFAEADLRFRGPLARGSSGVYFGVQLKGWAAGKGKSNGNYKGHQLFTCPEGCGLILSASELTVPRLSRTSSSGDHDRHTHQANQTSSSNAHQNHSPSPVSILSRAAESSPPALFCIGQRVCFTQGDAVRRGSVRFCGPLPDRPSSEVFVGVLLDHAVGSWDGVHKNTKLCSIPSATFGALLPLSHVTAETGSERSPPTAANPKALPKLPQLPPSNNTVLQPLSPTHDKEPTPTDRPLIQPAMLVTAKKALQPPSSSVLKVALKPPPLTGPKPPLKPPSLPPNKPQAPPTSPPTDPSRSFNNGFHSFPSPPPIVEQKAGLDTWFEVGSMVEVNDPPLFGVIRWIGQITGVPEPVAGIELDQEMSAATDGSYLGERHFHCPANKGLFVKLRNCRRDSRFPAPETPINQVDRCNSIAFANWSSQRVDENTPPVMGLDARVLYEGFKKGIQGHLNSCYLDASLFSVFSCCSSVDWVLFWPTEPQKNPRSRNAQDFLRCEIVNPLRRFGYVCASKTMTLRKLLQAETADAGYTNEEKDPEEFLNQLFLLLRVEPLLKIRSASRQPQECFIYQLFPPSVSPTPSSPAVSPPSPSLSPLALSSLMRVSSVQMLLESSFMHSGLKLTEAPSCLPLLMPRFGKEFKMFDVILPSMSLDITDLLDETVRQCSICQSLAQWECLQCYEDDDITPGQLKQYCDTCNTQVHTHRKRQAHVPVVIRGPQGSWEGPVTCVRQLMDLFAITCIETSHYVSFVKYGPHTTDWLFFDSMADREGGENGFNVPQVRACPEVGRYLSLSVEEISRLDASTLRDPVRRLLCDAYMCFYHCPELSLYK